MMKLVAAVVVMSWAGMGLAQAGAGQAPAAQGSQRTAPSLQLKTLGDTATPDPFPAVNPANFTADTPTAAQTESYLKAMLGYDPNRIWRVEAIQKTPAPGVSKVVALVSERIPQAKVLTAVFYVLPDGRHLIADQSGVQNFGAEPFAANRDLLRAKADGPAKGAASKDLMLVEFADLQCPKCKAAQDTMTRLAQDFPKARIVFENFPVAQAHPYAVRAAEDSVCVAKTSSVAFFTYAQAVFDGQAQLTPEGGQGILNGAITKAGLDPATVGTCAALPETKAAVEASVKLGIDAGVGETPTLAVNGRMVPIASVPYETLKQLIVFQAGMDGVSAAAAGPGAAGVGAAAAPGAAKP